MENTELTGKLFHQYYFNLENDFLKTTNFVFLHKDNFKTYSLEFLKLILLNCSGVERVLKALLNINIEKRVYMPTLIKKLKSEHNEFLNITIKSIILENDEIKPWNLDNGITPCWWTDYNNLKHKKLEDSLIPYATQKNAYHSLCALFSLLLAFYCKHKIKNAPYFTNLFTYTTWILETGLLPLSSTVIPVCGF